MSKNYSKNNYQGQKDIEERVQITKETCNSEEEIPAAIERSKRKLKPSNAPYGYSKIDEKITTQVYKVPDNEYVNENNIIKEEEYYENQNIGRSGYDHGNCQCDPNYEERYGRYEGYDEGNGYNNEELGTIYNFNNVAKNHEYHEWKNSGNNYNNKNIYNTDYKKSSTQTRNNYYNSNSNYNYNNTDYYNRNADFKLEYVSSVNPRKMKYVENYENNYNYNNKKPKSFIKYEKYTGGRIENYYENNISKDGQYLVTVSLSKIVNDPVSVSYESKNNNVSSTNKINNYNYKKEKIEVNINKEKPKKETIKSNNYSYKKENNEVTKNNQGPKREVIQSYKKVSNETNNDRFGRNYNYYERKENVTSSKKAETRQRMREPIQVQKGQKYTKTENTSSYTSNLPGKEVKTVFKSYKKEVIGNNNNVKSSSNTATKQYNANYKRSGNH